VSDEHTKTVDSVPDALPSRCVSGSPRRTTAGQSARLAENARIYASSLRTRRHGSSLMTCDVRSPSSRQCRSSLPAKVKHGDRLCTGDVTGKLQVTTTSDTALKDRVSNDSAIVQTTSEHRCNGHVVTSARPHETSTTDKKHRADVKLRKKKRKGTKPEGWFIITTCRSYRLSPR